MTNDYDPYRYVGQGGGTVMSTGSGESTQDRIIKSLKLIGERLLTLEAKFEALEKKLEDN